MNQTPAPNQSTVQSNLTEGIQHALLQKNTALVYLSLLVSSLISLTVLLAWLIPDISENLPPNWSKMQFATALSLLVLSLGELFKTGSFKHSQKTSKSRSIGAVLFGVVAIIIASNTLSQHAFGKGIPLNLVFVNDSQVHLSHLMSIQSSVCVLILGFLQIIDHKQTGLKGIGLDATYLALFTVILIYISGYVFGVFQFIGSSQDVLISSQALIAIIFLAYSAMIRRAPYGAFSVLVEQGTGSKFARILLPFAVLLSYVVIMYSNNLLTTSQLSMQTAAALTAAGLATILVVVVLFLAKRINRLENHLMDITITDELTQINNLRGFYLIGEQVYQDSLHTNNELSLYYFDLDGLKQVNDQFGHKIGSEMIKSFANILVNTFDRSDVVGRLGGDEFAVIAHPTKSSALPYAKKLQIAVDSYNTSVNTPFHISYSSGEIRVQTDTEQSLREWVHQADAAMYQAKNSKKIHHD